MKTLDERAIEITNVNKNMGRSKHLLTDVAHGLVMLADRNFYVIDDPTIFQTLSTIAEDLRMAMSLLHMDTEYSKHCIDHAKQGADMETFNDTERVSKQVDEWRQSSRFMTETKDED